jgi:hypothetical protein
MGANKRLEVAGKAPEAANADASDNKMDQIRELMFGGVKSCGKTWPRPWRNCRKPRRC